MINGYKFIHSQIPMNNSVINLLPENHHPSEIKLTFPGTIISLIKYLKILTQIFHIILVIV